MLKYKLTNQEMQTYNNCQWEIGKEKITDGNRELCSEGWLHFYHDPILAVFLNPIHADVKNPRIFECEASGEFKDDLGLKGGCTQITLTKEIDLPQVTTEQRVRFGILCVKSICHDKKWNKWADRWLDNTDRSATTAAESAITADNAICAAHTAANYADCAAYNISTAYYADSAAYYAACAAYYATNTGNINLIEIAHIVYYGDKNHHDSRIV